MAEDVLSKEALKVLAGENEAKTVIPAEGRQAELARVGELAASAATFPTVGETATLTYPSGRTENMAVNGYDKNNGNPMAQVGVGPKQATASNIDAGALRDLTTPQQ